MNLTEGADMIREFLIVERSTYRMTDDNLKEAIYHASREVNRLLSLNQVDLSKAIALSASSVDLTSDITGLVSLDDADVRVNGVPLQRLSLAEVRVLQQMPASSPIGYAYDARRGDKIIRWGPKANEAGTLEVTYTADLYEGDEWSTVSTALTAVPIFATVSDGGSPPTYTVPLYPEWHRVPIFGGAVIALEKMRMFQEAQYFKQKYLERLAEFARVLGLEHRVQQAQEGAPA